MTYIFFQESIKLISNTSYINTNNEIQLRKKYNFISITNVISLHIKPKTLNFIQEQ